MEQDFFWASLINLSLNLLYTFVALLVGIVSLQIIDKRLLKKIDIEEEIKKGNMAVSLFASTILIFVAVIVTFGFKG